MRYTEAGWSSTVLNTSRPQRTGTNAPCAIVPLKPNELSRPDDSQLCAHAITSAGMSNEAEETIDDKCKFNLHLDLSLDLTSLCNQQNSADAAACWSRCFPCTEARARETRGQRPRRLAPGGPYLTSKRHIAPLRVNSRRRQPIVTFLE